MPLLSKTSLISSCSLNASSTPAFSSSMSLEESPRRLANLSSTLFFLASLSSWLEVSGGGVPSFNNDLASWSEILSLLAVLTPPISSRKVNFVQSQGPAEGYHMKLSCFQWLDCRLERQSYAPYRLYGHHGRSVTSNDWLKRYLSNSATRILSAQHVSVAILLSPLVADRAGSNGKLPVLGRVATPAFGTILRAGGFPTWQHG